MLGVLIIVLDLVCTLKTLFGFVHTINLKSFEGIKAQNKTCQPTCKCISIWKTSDVVGGYENMRQSIRHTNLHACASLILINKTMLVCFVQKQTQQVPKPQHSMRSALQRARATAKQTV